jgi:anaerobic ribonucleoside-triphosphate reductase activating protein
MSKDTHSTENGKLYTIQSLVKLILKYNNEGITISGGEPFLQAQELTKMLHAIKKERDFGVIVYSGYTLEELSCKKEAQALLQEIDILIDGRYEEEQNDNISLRGSSNQKVHLLTDRYKDIYKDYYDKQRREIEIYIEDNGPIVIGIPKIGTVEKIKNHIKDKNE